MPGEVGRDALITLDNLDNKGRLGNQSGPFLLDNLNSMFGRIFTLVNYVHPLYCVETALFTMEKNGFPMLEWHK